MRVLRVFAGLVGLHAGGGRGDLERAARDEVSDDLRAHVVCQLQTSAGPSALAHAATLVLAPRATAS